jgi:hypothetical protein
VDDRLRQEIRQSFGGSCQGRKKLLKNEKEEKIIKVWARKKEGEGEVKLRRRRENYS